MKLAKRLLESVKLKSDDLSAVRDEVIDSFSEKEMKGYKSFKDFFAEVDVQMGYEEEWNPKKWKPYYEAIWNEWKSGKLKVKG